MKCFILTQGDCHVEDHRRPDRIAVCSIRIRGSAGCFRLRFRLDGGVGARIGVRFGRGFRAEKSQESVRFGLRFRFGGSIGCLRRFDEINRDAASLPRCAFLGNNTKTRPGLRLAGFFILYSAAD